MSIVPSQPDHLHRRLFLYKRLVNKRGGEEQEAVVVSPRLRGGSTGQPRPVPGLPGDTVSLCSKDVGIGPVPW